MRTTFHRSFSLLAAGMATSLCLPATASADAGLVARQEKGKAVFATCAACHGMDGKGLPTTPPMAPPLVGSKLATGPAEVATTIVLKGVQKTDSKYIGMMLPLAATLTDEQLADVLTYIRTSLNSAPAVAADDVKKWREKYKDIATPLSRATYEKKAEALSKAASATTSNPTTTTDGAATTK